MIRDHARNQSSRTDVLDRLRRMVSPNLQTRHAEGIDQGCLLSLLGVYLPAGNVVELVAQSNGPAGLSALACVSSLLCHDAMKRQQGHAAWVVTANAAFAPAVSSLGLNLTQTVWVRVRDTREALWACEQAARCRGVGSVVASLDRADGTSLRRIKLAAEAGGQQVVLWRSISAGQSASWADVRLRVSHLPSEEHRLSYRPTFRVDVLYQRGLTEERSYRLMWESFDDPLPVVSELANPKATKRPAPIRHTRRRKQLDRVG